MAAADRRKAVKRGMMPVLPEDPGAGKGEAMWNDPYLETCCRSALHRLVLCGPIGRPGGWKDGRCLLRLAESGYAVQRPDGRFTPTDAGCRLHRTEILGGGRKRRSHPSGAT